MLAALTTLSAAYASPRGEVDADVYIELRQIEHIAKLGII